MNLDGICAMTLDQVCDGSGTSTTVSYAIAKTDIVQGSTATQVKIGPFWTSTSTVLSGLLPTLTVTLPNTNTPIAATGAIGGNTNSEGKTTYTFSGTETATLGTITLTGYVAGSMEWSRDYQVGVDELTNIVNLVTSGGVIVSTAPLGSVYCGRSDVENIYGVSNIIQWSLLSTNDPTSDAGIAEIANRIAAEIQTQTAEIDDHLREGGYELPLSINESTLSLVRLCATMVGVALYENRGTIDYNHETGKVEHRYQFKKDWAIKRLDEIRSGKVRWDAARVSGANTGPQAQQTHHRKPRYGQDNLGNYGISGGNNY